MSTRKFSGFAKPALAMAFASVFSALQTATAAVCEDQMDALRDAVQSSCPYKYCDGLSHKLDNASHKLEQGKLVHAARKVADFGSIMEIMARHGEPALYAADYDAIMAAYGNVAGCIENGGKPAPDGDTGTDTGGGDEPPPISLPF